jgi:hypothetical protein
MGMSIILLAPSPESFLGEMRLAIPSSALLTRLVLQQACQRELPSTADLTRLEKLAADC